MDIAPEFKKFADSARNSQQPVPQQKPPLKQPLQRTEVREYDYTVGSTGADKPPTPAPKPTVSFSLVQPQSEALRQTAAALQRGQQRSPESYDPFAKQCFKCGYHDREDFMFYKDGNEYVCTTCYNPYLHKISSSCFFGLLGGAFLYPLKGNNLVALVMGSIFFGALTFFFRLSSLVVGAIGIAGSALLLEFLFSIINNTAEGSDDIPDWPDFNFGGISYSGWQFFIATLLPLIPAIAWYLFFVRTGCGGPFYDCLLILASPTMAGVMFIALMLAGLFFLPIALAAIGRVHSIVDSILQFSPKVYGPLLTRAPVEYLFTACLFTLVSGTELTVVILSVLVGGNVLGSVLSVPFSLYFLFVEMRMLGLFWRVASRRVANDERWKKLEQGKMPRPRTAPALDAAATGSR